MSYRSKYDKYWVRKLDELIKAIDTAYASGSSIIDISDIASYGRRKPESWYGKIILCKNNIVKDNVMVHLKSLGRILIDNDVLSRYEFCFSFKVTKDLKLVIERFSRDSIKNYRSFSMVRGRSREHSLINKVSKFRETPLGMNCKCDPVFHGFLWHELSTLRATDLPKKPGVYAIRIIEKGDDPIKVKYRLENVILKTGWNELIKYVGNRLIRVLQIRDCPVIYIGSTESIRSRYKELAGRRHTAFFPILALLLNGWKLDYGFKTALSENKAIQLERDLKRKYIGIHGTLPALVEK